MKEYISVLRRCPVFKNIPREQISDLIRSLNGVLKSYRKNEFIVFSGECIAEIGIVLSGSVSVIKEDFWGNRDIRDKIGIGGIFGEAICFSKIKSVSPGVCANSDCTILFISAENITGGCVGDERLKSTILSNMLTIMADKTVMLNRKIEHIVKRTTRDKLMSYLSSQPALNGKNEFDIPFNRQELADFLSVDRSAMSNELSKLQKEGMIEFKKNHFILKHGI